MAYTRLLLCCMAGALFLLAESDNPPGYPTGSFIPRLDKEDHEETPPGFPSGSSVFVLKGEENGVRRIEVDNETLPGFPSGSSLAVSQKGRINDGFPLRNDFAPEKRTTVSVPDVKDSIDQLDAVENRDRYYGAMMSSSNLKNGQRTLAGVPKETLTYSTQRSVPENTLSALIVDSEEVSVPLNADDTNQIATQRTQGARMGAEGISSSFFLINIPKRFMTQLVGQPGLRYGSTDRSGYVTESKFAFQAEYDASETIRRRPRYILESANATGNSTNDLLHSIKEIALRMVEKEEFLLFAAIAGCFCLVGILIQWALCLACRLCVKKNKSQKKQKSIYAPVHTSETLLPPPPAGDVKRGAL